MTLLMYLITGSVRSQLSTSASSSATYDWPTIRAGVLELNAAALAFLRHLRFQPVKEGVKQFPRGEQRFIVFERPFAEA
jgi:hypothetical protein